MNIVDLLKKNIVMVPVVASVIVGTFTGVRYIVSLTETINKNKTEITVINDTHLFNFKTYIARIQENQNTGALIIAFVLLALFIQPGYIPR